MCKAFQKTICRIGQGSYRERRGQQSGEPNGDCRRIAVDDDSLRLMVSRPAPVAYESTTSRSWAPRPPGRPFSMGAATGPCPLGLAELAHDPILALQGLAVGWHQWRVVGYRAVFEVQAVPGRRINDRAVLDDPLLVCGAGAGKQLDSTHHGEAHGRPVGAANPYKLPIKVVRLVGEIS